MGNQSFKNRNYNQLFLQKLIGLVILTGVILTIGWRCSKESPMETEQPPTSTIFETQLESLVPALMQQFSVPGVAVAFIENGQVAWKKGVGFANIETGLTVTESTVFNIGSISKIFTGWGAMRLAAEGQIDFDVPIETYLTRWQFPSSQFDHSKITLRRLLAHQGGTSLSGYPGFSLGTNLPTLEQSLSGATNGAGDVRIVYDPGSATNYSGGGITVTQLAIEEVSGQPFAEYMKAQILNPLGMLASDFRFTPEIQSTLATPYNPNGDAVSPRQFVALGAAGLMSTLDDMTNFALSVISAANNNSSAFPGLDAQTINWILDAQPATGLPYRLAHQVRQLNELKYIGHVGSNLGWTAQIQIAPTEGHAIIIMTNSSNGLPVHNGLVCKWLEHLTGETAAEFCWVFN